MGDQRVDQSAGAVPCCRVYDKAGRLFDHDHIFVFIDDVERDVFAGRPRRFCFGDFQRDFVARVDPVFGVSYCRAAHLDFALEDQAFQPRAAQFLDFVRKEAVETRALILRICGNFETLTAVCCHGCQKQESQTGR